ncbi:Cyclic di-GMP phosphodiesterase response regulator RpfG [compost metagenome]
MIDQLAHWQALAKLPSELEAIASFKSKLERIYSLARTLLSAERAHLFTIGRTMAELSAPGRNQLPFFEYLALQRNPVLVQEGELSLDALPSDISDWRYPTLLFIPLIAREQALGVLAIGSRETRDYTPDEEALLAAFVPLVTSLAESEILRRDLERQQTHATFLAEFDAAFLKPEIAEVLGATASLVQRGMQAERALIFTRKGPKRELEVAAAAGCPYAMSGKLADHACGRIARELAESPRPLTHNAEAIQQRLGGEPHDRCVERQVVAVPIATSQQFYGVLELYNKTDGTDFSASEVQLLQEIAAKLALAMANVELYGELQQAALETIKSLARALDSKDKYTANHSENVSQYGFLIACKMGLPFDVCERIKLAGILHDVGKIGIPDAILNKPDRLTDEEFAIIKQHPGKGYRILEPYKGLRDVADAACSHHERYDGNGYPRRLKGDAIPLGGRILALADAFDTLTSDRKYRPRVDMDWALNEMHRCAGNHFDPTVVEAFFLAMADLGPIDLNRNALPPRELLLEMAATVAKGA